MRKKSLPLSMIAVIFLLSILFIPGCSGGGGDSGGPGPVSNTGQPGDTGPRLSASISFDVSGSESLIATQNEASQTPAPALAKMAQSLGLRKKSFTFYDSKRHAAPGAFRGVATTSTTTTSGGDAGASGSYGGPYPDTGVFTTNFFSVKPDGSMDFAVKSDGGGSAPVMYSVSSKDGAYVYVAFQYFMTNDNCAIYKVKVEDNSYTCLDTGYVPQDANSYQLYYAKKINGNIKPIQVDETGNVYYLGYKVTDPYNPGGYYGQSPVVRKVDADGNATSLTSDLTNVQSFLVMKNGVLVYTYQTMGTGANDAGIKIYDPVSKSTNKLTDDSAGQWWGDMFFSVDDNETVVFGSADSQAGGVYFGQRYGNGGRYVVKLDTSLFGNTSGNGWSSAPTRLIIGDDGNLYGLFIENTPVMGTNGQYDPSQWDNYLRLYQLLPYAATPKASVKLSNNDWWTAMNGVDTQVSKGYAYMVEKEKNIAGTYSDRTIIKAFDLADGSITKLLADDEWNQRYDIYTWRLVGDIINFSGFDNVTSEMVMGTIDTKKVKNGEPSSSYLSVNSVASAAGASSQVLDMEVLTPQQPKTDTGEHPYVTGLFVDPENLYSASVKFSKYMDKDLADAGVHLQTNGVEVRNMKVWFNQTLHLIVDQDGTDLAGTDPLDWNTPYELSVDQSVQDAWGWSITTLPAIGSSKSFTTRPETGWYPGVDDVTGVPAEVSDGNVGKYVTDTNMTAAAQTTVMRLMRQSTAPNIRVQFSARNKASWGDLSFALKDHDTQSGQAWNSIVSLSLGNNGYNYNAWDATGMGIWGDNWNIRSFSNSWSQFTIDIYGDTLKLTIDYLDGTTPVTMINKTGLALYYCADGWDWNVGSGCYNNSGTTSWDLDFMTNSPSAVFDNFVVSRLTSTGAETGETIFNEPFSGGTITSALTTEFTYTQ